MARVKIKLSENFSRHEFACNCGCGKDTVDVELIELCEVVRAFVGAAIVPRSGHRCKRHNTRVGGVERSQHLDGRAADLPVVDPIAVYRMLCGRYPGRYGFGVYDSMVHVDSRTNGPARWDKRTVKRGRR